ncbi:MAG: hypothetical protein ACRCUY_00680 [Thermoguttaceae bacterium]
MMSVLKNKAFTTGQLRRSCVFAVNRLLPFQNLSEVKMRRLPEFNFVTTGNVICLRLINMLQKIEYRLKSGLHKMAIGMLWFAALVLLVATPFSAFARGSGASKSILLEFCQTILLLITIGILIGIIHLTKKTPFSSFISSSSSFTQKIYKRQNYLVAIALIFGLLILHWYFFIPYLIGIILIERQICHVTSKSLSALSQNDSQTSEYVKKCGRNTLDAQKSVFVLEKESNKENDDSEAETSGATEIDAITNGVVLQLMRSQTDFGADRLEAIFVLEFLDEQETMTIHLPFFPPFDSIPAIQTFLLEEADAKITIPVKTPFGIRIDVKCVNSAQNKIRLVVEAEEMRSPTFPSKSTFQ